jgi:hypothetical protein
MPSPPLTGDPRLATELLTRLRNIKTVASPGATTLMPEPYADTLATVATARTALVARLRTLATRVEALPLDAAAAVLIWLEPALAALEQQAGLALERAPSGAQ